MFELISTISPNSFLSVALPVISTGRASPTFAWLTGEIIVISGGQESSGGLLVIAFEINAQLFSIWPLFVRELPTSILISPVFRTLRIPLFVVDILAAVTFIFPAISLSESTPNVKVPRFLIVPSWSIVIEPIEVKVFSFVKIPLTSKGP